MGVIRSCLLPGHCSESGPGWCQLRAVTLWWLLGGLKNFPLSCVQREWVFAALASTFIVAGLAWGWWVWVWWAVQNGAMWVGHIAPAPITQGIDCHAGATLLAKKLPAVRQSWGHRVLCSAWLFLNIIPEKFLLSVLILKMLYFMSRSVLCHFTSIPPPPIPCTTWEPKSKLTKQHNIFYLFIYLLHLLSNGVCATSYLKHDLRNLKTHLLLPKNIQLPEKRGHSVNCMSLSAIDSQWFVLNPKAKPNLMLLYVRCNWSKVKVLQLRQGALYPSGCYLR